MGLIVLGLFLIVAGKVVANEGTVELSSKNGEMGGCFAASIYIDGRYRVLMTCRGLRSALDPVKNKYVAWVKKGENFKRLGEVVNGKMQGSIDQDFEKMVITVEKDNYPNKPSGEALLSGELEKIKLDSGQGRMTDRDEVVITPTLTPTPVTEKTAGTAGTALKAFGKALLTGFLVLLGVVGVLSYLSRKRRS